MRTITKQEQEFMHKHFGFEFENEGEYHEEPLRRSDGLRPYDYSAIVTDSCHAQGFIMREINMDEHSDWSYSIDSDRARQLGGKRYEDLCEEFYGVRGDQGIGNWAKDKASKAKLLAFVTRMHEIVEGSTKIFDGVRVVRYTNVGNCQPYFTIQMKEKR